MADIIRFPTQRPADAVGALHRSIGRLAGLSAELDGLHDSLHAKYDTLGELKERLLDQAARSYAMGALAQRVEAAIAAGDSVAMAALQDEIARLRKPVADCDPACRQVDAAD